MMNITLATIKNFTELLKLSGLLDSTEASIKKENKIKQALNNKLVWVAKNGGSIIGYCLVELFNNTHDQLPNSIFISELYVLESHRKQGVGKGLLHQVLKTNFPVQYKYFSLSHDPEKTHLTDFYRSVGFEVVGKTKGGNVKMSKQI